MNKTQLVDAVAEKADLPKAKAAVAVDALLDAITGALQAEDAVALVGFGTWAVKKRAARVGRDPRTGGPLQIPAATVVGFKAGKALKDAVNSVGASSKSGAAAAGSR